MPRHPCGCGVDVTEVLLVSTRATRPDVPVGVAKRVVAVDVEGTGITAVVQVAERLPQNADPKGNLRAARHESPFVASVPDRYRPSVNPCGGGAVNAFVGKRFRVLGGYAPSPRSASLRGDSPPRSAIVRATRPDAPVGAAKRVAADDVEGTGITADAQAAERQPLSRA